MTVSAFLQLCFATAIFIGAASSAKAWSISPSFGRAIFTLVLYVIGNLLVMRLLRQVGMAAAFSITAVLQLVAVNLVAIFIMRRIATSPFGRVLEAIRDNEEAVKALGKDPAWFKYKVLMLGDGARLRLLLGDGAELLVKRPAAAGMRGLTSGAAVAVAWHPGNAWVFPKT